LNKIKSGLPIPATHHTVRLTSSLMAGR